MGRRRRKQLEKAKLSERNDATYAPKQDGSDVDDDEPTMGELLQKKCGLSHSKAEVMDLKSNSNIGPKMDLNVNERPDGVENKSNNRRDAPREISSRRPVPSGRDMCVGVGSAPVRSVRRFDPRFEDHCGDLRLVHIERNYNFLGEARERRRAELQSLLSSGGITSKKEEKRLKKGISTAANPRIVERAAKELEKMEQADLRRNAILTRREVEKEFKEREKELVRRGKKPYFLKERDLRRLELRKKFEGLKKEGGAQKFIDKKRRRIVGKQKKLLSRSS